MKIRAAQISDAPGISRVHIDSWRSTYRGIVPDQVLDGLDYERNTIRQRETLSDLGEMKCFLVAVTTAGQIVGFAIGGPNRSEDTGYGGELYGIYLLKEYQGQGIGRALVASVADWLLNRGYGSMLVWVLDENPAKHFYQALGGKFVSRKKIDIGGALLEEVSYGWGDLNNLVKELNSRMSQ
jgi:GNAT superfamily N-acetyltransferase